MICPSCGALVQGRFCSSCGLKLQQSPFVQKSVSAPSSKSSEHNLSSTRTDTESGKFIWHNEIRYHIVIQVPEVRNRIMASSKLAPLQQGNSFVEWLDRAKPGPDGMKPGKITALSRIYYEQAGIKTGKSDTTIFNHPPGKVMAAVLCSLAKRGQVIKQVKQGEDGCLFEARVAPDMRSNEGSLVIKLQKMNSGVLIEASTLIPGQLLDWGKSRRILKDLFNDTAAVAPSI